MEKLKFTISFLLFFISGIAVIKAQTITAVWTGKINLQKVEVKIILEGADLTGTTCYYESPNIYMRYGVKGYFNSDTKEVVWWDDQLIEEKGHGPSGGNTHLLVRAYFNCPGYGRLISGEKASNLNRQLQRAREVSLDYTNPKDFLLLFILGISVNLFSQTKKEWTLKVDPKFPAKTKQVFDGKKVKEGINKIEISKESYVNVIVKKAAIVNMICVASSNGITLSTDLVVARANNPQMSPCQAQLFLCQIQCKLGKIPDPMHPDSCLDQCDKAAKVCPALPFGGGFGGIMLQ